jgi:hypothetical protein
MRPTWAKNTCPYLEKRKIKAKDWGHGSSGITHSWHAEGPAPKKKTKKPRLELWLRGGVCP